jgi:REP element-mobilizing transposase RayT
MVLGYHVIITTYGFWLPNDPLAIWACSVLPEHIHLVLRRYRFKIEQAVNLLKGAATTRLDEQKLHPLKEHRQSDGRLPPMWTRREWKVYLDDATDIRRAIRYVEENPVKEGKRRQFWSFVSPYDEVARSPAALR